jgi:transcriptional regulator with XRE-family HTH domain
MGYGERIRERRLMAGLTIDELSARSGVARGRISEIERERWNPTLRTLERLASALGCETWELMLAEPDVPPGVRRVSALCLELDERRLELLSEFAEWLARGARRDAVIDRLRPPSERRLRALARWKRRRVEEKPYWGPPGYVPRRERE